MPYVSDNLMPEKNPKIIDIEPKHQNKYSFYRTVEHVIKRKKRKKNCSKNSAGHHLLPGKVKMGTEITQNIYPNKKPPRD